MFQQLKSMVWDSSAADKAAAEKTADAAKKAPTMAATVPQPPQPPHTTGFVQATSISAEPVLDIQALTTMIDQHITEHPGFVPFATFAEKEAALATVISDEGTRFKAAGATAGIPKDVLLGSVNVSAEVLAGEAKNFEETYCAQVSSNIAQNEAEIEQLAAQIAELNSRVIELVRSSDEKRAAVTRQTAELAKARIDYASINTTLANRYQTLASKIQQYL